MDEWTISDDKPEFRVEDDIGAVDSGPTSTIAVKAPPEEADQGPCLYLGPAGQRCYRPAVKNGFCGIHQPGATAARAKLGKKSKLAAAIAGLGGVLWPYVYDFLRELIRILHPR